MSCEEISDEDLLELAKAHQGKGKNDAWGELLLRITTGGAFQKSLIANSNRNAEEAKDFTQEAILRTVVLPPGKFENIADLIRFLADSALVSARIDAHRKSHALKRNKGKLPLSYSNDPMLANELIGKEVAPHEKVLLDEAIEEIRSKLNNDGKKIFDCGLAGLSVAETAKSTGFHIRKIQRILEKIKDMLSERQGHER